MQEETISGGWGRQSMRALSRRRIVLGATFAAMLAVLAAVLLIYRPWTSPPDWTTEPAPHGFVLLQPQRLSSQIDSVSRDITVTFTITNPTDHVVVIVRLGSSIPGLAFQSAQDTATPTHVDANGQVTVSLRYHLTDCAAVPETEAPVPVQVKVPSGTGTVHLSLPSDGPHDPWQQFVTRPLCGSPSATGQQG